MPKRIYIALAVVVVALGGVIAWQGLRLRRPVFQGKGLHVWLEEASQKGDIPDWQCWMGDAQPDTSTARAIRAIGTNALPILMSMLRTKDTPLRERLARLSDRHNWFPTRLRDASTVRWEARYAFEVLGPSAKAAVPDLVALLKDDDQDVPIDAALCLGKIGRASAGAVPDLEKRIETALRYKVGDTRCDWGVASALYALGEIGPAARPALSQITALTNTGDSLIDGAARAALIKLTGSGLDAALKPLEDPSNLDNWLAAQEVVRHLGRNAAPAIPLLLANLRQSDDTYIQMEAIYALGWMHAHPEQCIPAITPFLRSTDPGLRGPALTAISAFGSSARPWVPTSEILRCLAVSNPFERSLVTNVLRRVAPEDAAKVGIK